MLIVIFLVNYIICINKNQVIFVKYFIICCAVRSPGGNFYRVHPHARGEFSISEPRDVNQTEDLASLFSRLGKNAYKA